MTTNIVDYYSELGKQCGELALGVDVLALIVPKTTKSSTPTPVVPDFGLALLSPLSMKSGASGPMLLEMMMDHDETTVDNRRVTTSGRTSSPPSSSFVIRYIDDEYDDDDDDEIMKTKKKTTNITKRLGSSLLLKEIRAHTP
jgi:hypothetical protein